MPSPTVRGPKVAATSRVHPDPDANLLRHSRIIKNFVEHRVDVRAHTPDLGLFNPSESFDGFPPARFPNAYAVLPVLEVDAVKVEFILGQDRYAASEQCLDRTVRHQVI